MQTLFQVTKTQNMSKDGENREISTWAQITKTQNTSKDGENREIFTWAQILTKTFWLAHTQLVCI